MSAFRSPGIGGHLRILGESSRASILAHSSAISAFGESGGMIHVRPVSSGLSMVTQFFREAGRLSRRRAAIQGLRSYSNFEEPLFNTFRYQADAPVNNPQGNHGKSSTQH